MEILAYRKKPALWSGVPRNEDGSIKTGKVYPEVDDYFGIELGDEPTRIDVPIFRAKLRYHNYFCVSGSFVVYFEQSPEEAVIAELKGQKPELLETSATEGMRIMELLAKRSNNFEYHDDGWFTGIFTFAKRGTRVILTEYHGKLHKERKVK